MNNPNRLNSNNKERFSLQKKIGTAAAAASLAVMGFLGHDRIAHNNDTSTAHTTNVTPTEISIATATPTMSVDGNRIIIADKTPTPTFLSLEETQIPTEEPAAEISTKEPAAEISTKEPATATMTPIVFDKDVEPTMTPIVFDGDMEATGDESTKIQPIDGADVPTAVEGSADQVVAMPEEEVATEGSVVEEQPTIAPVQTAEIAGDEEVAEDVYVPDVTSTEVIEPDNLEASAPIEPNERDSIGPDGEVPVANIEAINVQVQPGDDIPQVLARILEQAGYPNMTPEQLSGITNTLMSTIDPESVFEGGIVINKETYTVEYAGEGSLAPQAAELIYELLMTKP